MRVIFLLIFFLAASFGELDFNSKTRNFSIELLYHTAQDSNRDVMISPYVIWSLLISMAYETLGSIREQFSKVFSLTENRSEVVEEYTKLRTAVLANEGVPIKELLNFVIYDDSSNVCPDSIRRLESDFSFIAKRLSFQRPHAMQLAHSFLGSYDDDLDNILRPEDFENSTMIMCSYCLFEALWLNFFNCNNSYTSVHYYYQDGNLVGKTNMMYMKARLRSSDLESLHASVTELPYRGGKYCMLLVRPHAGYDIVQVLRNLREVSLKDVLDTLQREAEEFGKREVAVKLPRSEINSRVILNRPLINMGLSDAFERNFSNFDNFAEDNAYIEEFTHSVTVTFTLSSTIVYTTIPTDPLYTKTTKQISVEEPFIFFIMEKSTATVLFGGTYSKIDID